MRISQTSASELQTRLLGWYDRHRRELPWRAKPGEPADAYRVWLSEIMLQQTTVAAVSSYFREFTARWPDVAALAGAGLDEVLQRWAGLGYYARARNLHKCAQVIVNDHAGVFPVDESELIKLPGIGPYTAAAIAAIAFDQPVAAVDGNVERVITRLFTIGTPLPDAKPQITAITRQLVATKRPGDFAQAMMDLGATVCMPAKANCLICPLSEMCKGRATGLANTLPRKRPKAARPTRHGTAFWIERPDGAVLVRRRAEKGLLGGMVEVPSSDWSDMPDAQPHAQAPMGRQWRNVDKNVEHTFTHFHLKLNIVRTEVGEDAIPDLPNGCRWVQPDDLGAEALPSVMKKVVTAVLGPDALKRAG